MFQTRSAKPATRISASAIRCGRRTRPHVSWRRPARWNTGPLVRCLRMAGTAATERDAQHLLRAIELAGRARGQTSPNPLVGAVVVKDGRVIGEGITQPPGESHAERDGARGGGGPTPPARRMYVSLEPCCHHGRTPPCTDAILAAGIARVVIASDDPTAKAAGRGPGILRDEGVQRGLRGRRDRRGRAPAQPALPQARAHRPPARGLQVRDDARRQGRHRAPATRSGSPARRAAPARTAGAPSRTPWRSASAPRSRTTRR